MEKVEQNERVCIKKCVVGGGGGGMQVVGGQVNVWGSVRVGAPPTCGTLSKSSMQMGFSTAMRTMQNAPALTNLACTGWMAAVEAPARLEFTYPGAARSAGPRLPCCPVAPSPSMQAFGRL